MPPDDVWENLKKKFNDMIVSAANGDPKLERYLRRQVENWAVNQGSGKMGSQKARLKKELFAKQNGLCAECRQPLDMRGCELDRIDATFADEPDQGYRAGNVRCVHPGCHPRGPYPGGRKPK